MKKLALVCILCLFASTAEARPRSIFNRGVRRSTPVRAKIINRCPNGVCPLNK